MNRVDNPELDRLILTHLADLYKIKEKREGIHLSTLVYCLTRSFFDQVAPIEPTDEEVMLYALGLGLQDVLTPKEAERPVYEKDGITFSPDFVLNITPPELLPVYDDVDSHLHTITVKQATYAELKTTRMSSNKEDLPETWLEYIEGGCYMRGINKYELSVLYMLGNYRPPFPTIHSETLVFEEEELKSNWEYLLLRKEIYEEALADNKPPYPFSWCKDWECKYCRYKLQCQAIEMVAKEPEQNAARMEDWDT